MIRSTTGRMYRRIPADYPACYLLNQLFQQGQVRDLSLNGFRIAGQSGLLPNKIVMVRLWLPGEEGPLDIDQAIVRWVNDSEFGIQIIALSNEADLRLALHVERALERASTNQMAS